MALFLDLTRGEISNGVFLVCKLFRIGELKFEKSVNTGDSGLDDSTNKTASRNVKRSSVNRGDGQASVVGRVFSAVSAMNSANVVKIGSSLSSSSFSPRADNKADGTKQRDYDDGTRDTGSGGGRGTDRGYGDREINADEWEPGTENIFSSTKKSSTVTLEAGKDFRRPLGCAVLPLHSFVGRAYVFDSPIDEAKNSSSRSTSSSTNKKNETAAVSGAVTTGTDASPVKGTTTGNAFRNTYVDTCPKKHIRLHELPLHLQV